METLFTYFIKVSVLISLFYLSYHFLLKRETFFSKNRLFLLLGLVTSVILPIVTITKIVWVEPVVFDEPFILSDFSNERMPDILYTEVQQSEINWSYIVAGFYLLGMFFFLVKFILSSLSLYKILHKSPNTKQNGFKFINSKNVKTPFSFFNYIAFDSTSFSEEELQNIIIHEKVHSKQKHSFDIILSEIFSVVFWLNPFVWLYKKAIQQNLEFIADNKAIKTSENKVNYQKTLLKITINPKGLALANPFFQPLIKKRIIMLNKKQSKKVNIIKYAVILPILAVFVMQFQTKVVAQEKTTVISQEKEQQYKLPTSVEWEYAKDTLVIGDTIVWVKDFSKSYDDEMENQSTGEKNIVKINSWEDVKKILKIEPENNTLGKNALILINGQDISEFKKMKIEEFEFEGLISITTYTKEEAVKKFGEKAKDGAIILEGKVTNFNLKASTKSSNEKELIKFLKSVKDYNKIEIYNRWGNLSYSLKSGEKIDEQKLNVLDDGRYYYVLENKSAEKENGYVYKGEKPAITKQSEREQRLKEREELLNQKGAEHKERERQARENSNLSEEELKERTEKLEERKKMLEERRKGLGKRLDEREVQIEERRKMIEERRKELGKRLEGREEQIEERKKELEERRSEKTSQYKITLSDKAETYSIISKNSSDSDIESIKSKMQENGIQMKVSNLKRNKNGEIYKITISLTENSGAENNKRKAKSEATFERKNEAIPNISLGKQNGNLIVSSSIK